MKAHGLFMASNYVNTMNELSGCLNDAHDLYKLCAPKLNTATKLLGRKASRDGIIKAVRKVLHDLGPGDLAFLTFSGHGTQDTDTSGDEASGQDQALVCDGFDLIFDDELAPVINDRDKDSWVIALLDCCHSQSLHRGVHSNRPRTMPFRKCKRHKRGPAYPNPRALRKAGFIAGCEEDSYSYDAWFDGRANGALTYYTIKAIKELKRGATFNDLFQKIGGKRPRGYLPSDDYPQSPQKMGAAANFARKIPFL